MPGWAARLAACTRPMRPDPHRATLSFFTAIPAALLAIGETAPGGCFQITKHSIRFCVLLQASPDQLSLGLRRVSSHRLVTVKISGEAVAFSGGGDDVAQEPVAGAVRLELPQR